MEEFELNELEVMAKIAIDLYNNNIITLDEARTGFLIFEPSTIIDGNRFKRQIEG
jgi:hypothetical protein